MSKAGFFHFYFHGKQQNSTFYISLQQLKQNPGGHLKDIIADGGSYSLSSMKVLSGDDREISNDGLGIESQLGERGLVLGHKLLLLLISPDCRSRRFLPFALTNPKPRIRRRAAPWLRHRPVPIGDILGKPGLLQAGLPGAVHGGSAGALHIHTRWDSQTLTLIPTSMRGIKTWEIRVA